MRSMRRSDLPWPVKVVAFAIAAVLVIAVVGAILAAVIAVEGLIIWALWNALVPSLASGPSVTYAQGVLIGVALNIVGAILSVGSKR